MKGDEKKATNLPKLLRRILPRNTLQNLRTAGMVVDEIRDVVHAVLDDYV